MTLRFFLLTCLVIGSPLSAQARRIQPPLPLKFFEKGAEGKPDIYLGASPAKDPQGVNVPSTDRWYAAPVKRYTDEDRQALARVIRGQKIPGLDLSERWDFTNENLAAYQDLVGLRHLVLDRTRINDVGLAHVGKMTGLETLVLNSQITDAGLAELKNLKHLKRLRLHGAKVTDKGLRMLKDLPNLEAIDLSGTPITDATARLLASMRSLREIDISDTTITDKGAASLAKLDDLRILYLPAGVSDASVRKIAVLKNLKSLDLSGALVTEASVSVIAESKSLRELALSGTAIGNTALLYLSRMKNLQTLEVSDTAVSGPGFSQAHGFARLETLGLSWGELTEPEVKALAGLPRLKNVVLHGWTLSGESLDRIRALAKLKKPVPERPVEQVSLPTPKAPSKHVSGGYQISPRLQDKPRVARGLSAGAVRPGDVAPGSSARPMISMGAPQGEPMIIEVGAAPRGVSSGRPRRLTGLKRIHQMELGEAPSDLDLAPGASPRIASPEHTAANSLGEINVNSR